MKDEFNDLVNNYVNMRMQLRDEEQQAARRTLIDWCLQEPERKQAERAAKISIIEKKAMDRATEARARVSCSPEVVFGLALAVALEAEPGLFTDAQMVTVAEDTVRRISYAK